MMTHIYAPCIAFFAFFLFAKLCFATIDIKNDVWILHPHVTGSVYLLERVFEIEDLANNKCWEMSAKLAKDLSN